MGQRERERVRERECTEILSEIDDLNSILGQNQEK